MTAEALPDRWRRAFTLWGPGVTPRFDGPVAEVKRTVRSGGRLSEVNTWRFDERGWPTYSEPTIYLYDQAYTSFAEWHYGDDGQPTGITWRVDAPAEIAITWGETTADVVSESLRIRYVYDPGRDVLTADQTLPAELGQVYAFEPDGSYTLTNSARPDGRTWTELVVAFVDRRNVETRASSEVVTNVTSFGARDEHGNPTRAERVSLGLPLPAATIVWDIAYR